MSTLYFELERIQHLRYVDGKEDKFVTGILDRIFNDNAVLTPEQEEGLYRQYWGILMGVAQRYVANRETAREVVNDSFVKAFNKLSSFRGKGPDRPIILKAWLIRITVNTAIDRLRSETLSSTLSLNGLETQLTVEMEDGLQVSDILMLLHELPDLHRIIFNLYELDGYSHKEIGEIMGIPTSSSRVYLTKAKQKLRVLYNKYFGGRHDG